MDNDPNEELETAIAELMQTLNDMLDLAIEHTRTQVNEIESEEPTDVRP